MAEWMLLTCTLFPVALLGRGGYLLAVHFCGTRKKKGRVLSVSYESISEVRIKRLMAAVWQVHWGERVAARDAEKRRDLEI